MDAAAEEVVVVVADATEEEDSTMDVDVDQVALAELEVAQVLLEEDSLV